MNDKKDRIYVIVPKDCLHKLKRTRLFQDLVCKDTIKRIVGDLYMFTTVPCNWGQPSDTRCHSRRVKKFMEIVKSAKYYEFLRKGNDLDDLDYCAYDYYGKFICGSFLGFVLNIDSLHELACKEEKPIMVNTAMNTYVFYGDKSSLDKVYADVNKMYDEHNHLINIIPEEVRNGTLTAEWFIEDRDMAIERTDKYVAINTTSDYYGNPEYWNQWSVEHGCVMSCQIFEYVGGVFTRIDPNNHFPDDWFVGVPAEYAEEFNKLLGNAFGGCGSVYVDTEEYRKRGVDISKLITEFIDEHPSDNWDMTKPLTYSSFEEYASRYAGENGELQFKDEDEVEEVS